MLNLFLEEILTSSDRYKLYLLRYQAAELEKKIQFLNASKINVINLGLELSHYIDSLDDFRYLTIDVYDFVIKLLDKNKSKFKENSNNVLAIYNLGILWEASLELNVTSILKEFSKSSSLIILWENNLEIAHRLTWPTQSGSIFLDFSDIQLKELKHEI
jgi:hypothetical protein